MKAPLFTEMNASELLERYAAGERNFAGIYVRGKLNGAILSDANFCGAVFPNSMEGIDFSRSYLIGADLAEVNLLNGILRNVRLDGVNLCQSLLGGADLTDACLARADLDGTLMENTNLHRANLIGAFGVDVEYWLEQGCIFCHTTMPDGSERNDGCQRLAINVN